MRGGTARRGGGPTKGISFIPSVARSLVVVGMGNGSRMKMSRFADFSRCIPARSGEDGLSLSLSLSLSLESAKRQRFPKVPRNNHQGGTARRRRRRGGSELPICGSPGRDRPAARPPSLEIDIRRIRVTPRHDWGT